MMQRIRNAMEKLKEEKGFTLVEMALVLIIIGIIIGAIVKGKDLVRGAEQKRIYSKFVNGWRLAYLNFYDRTGKLLGDFYDTAGAAAGQDGFCDTDADGGGTVTAAEIATLITGGGAAYRGLATVGLKAPVTNTANAYQYNYVDSQGNNHTLEISFLYNGAAGNTYNYMQIAQIPNELAMALDTMIDGSADGTATGGDFINAAAADWGAPTTAVTARWKMQF
jgi:prepilin-type N-terminal cleavage/methylation domain-containing protein